MKKIFLIFIFFGIQINIISEYRVFLYKVQNKISSKETSESQIITSTLSPKSYLSYHGGSQSISINLLKTWMCKGHTGLNPICISPFESLPKEFK